MKIIHVICGPTASGKSALAVDLARKQDGVVINADSMQIYEALPTLTAQPSAEEQSLVPHALYATLPAYSKCSAQRWRDMAAAEITKTLAEGKAPVVVGGTGLYLKALMSGLAQMPDIPADIRQIAVTRQKELGSDFHRDLASRKHLFLWECPDRWFALHSAPFELRRLVWRLLSPLFLLR